MVYVIFTWIVIFCATLLFGYIAVNVGYKSSIKTLGSLDIYLVLGLMLINVYAEYFSIVYKVGAMACLVLCLMGLATLLAYILLTKDNFFSYIRNIGYMKEWQWIVGGIVLVAILSYTVDAPMHFDTDSYHNQAIQWVEKYGVVPGLGNLHNRFAYNSAFIPLQALFSFEWLFDQSLHTVNGYVCLLFLTYSMLTNNFFQRKKLQLSDFFKLAVLVYIAVSRGNISSPSTDTLVLLLILYICMKWSEFEERGEKDALPYTLLCVLAVYAISLKLSAATCVVLVLYPLTLLIQKKEWKKIFGNMLLGVVIVLPWLIRNVIISGYLLYPYPQLDLFDVDWKMLSSVATYDSREIMVWGRGTMDVATYGDPIWNWIGSWFVDSMSIELVLGIISIAGLFMFLLYVIAGKFRLPLGQFMLVLYSFVGLAGWFFSAPLLRYGLVYLLIPTCLFGYQLYLMVQKNSIMLKAFHICFLVILIWNIGNIAEKWDELSAYPVRQAEYMWRPTQEHKIEEGFSVWIPEVENRGSFDVFPCVPYLSMVEKIELRGKTFSEGFRVKAEYLGDNLTEYGSEW